jgi:hypothetical protein
MYISVGHECDSKISFAELPTVGSKISFAELPLVGSKISSAELPSVGSRIQRFKDSRIQEFKDSKDSKIQDSKIQGFSLFIISVAFRFMRENANHFFPRSLSEAPM